MLVVKCFGWRMQKYFSLLITNDLVWPHSVVDIAFAWFQSTSVVISLKLMLHVISLFLQPISIYFKWLQISLTITQEIKTSVISSFKLIEGFPIIKTLRQFHVVTFFFAKKRHVIFILGFLQLKPDSNCGKIEGQKSKKRKPENCGKYVHMYIASTRRA